MCWVVSFRRLKSNIQEDSEAAEPLLPASMNDLNAAVEAN